MSSIICPLTLIRSLRKKACAFPIGRSIFVVTVSAFTTSNMIRNVLGSSQEPSPARRKRMTLVPAEAEYELLPSVWKVTLRLSCTYWPLEGNLKLKLSMRTSSAEFVRFSIYIIIYGW